ncbi:endo-1,4-beta-xylanase [Parvularcula marina]|nr:endo-1,4-beta-xylanase [Parvularcula marina]
MPQWSRREMLALSSGALLTACSGGGGSSSSVSVPPPPPPPPPPAGSPSLAELSAGKGMRFGTAINTGTGSTFNDNNYLNLVREECNVAVAENDLKWQAIRPSPDMFTFTGGDALVNFAQTENIGFRGHTLLWEDETRYPSWFDTYDFGADPAMEAERLLTEHISTVGARYQGQIDSWDVVNEAVNPGNGAYRSSPFSRNLGSMEAVLDIAFQTARDTLPNTQLVYNDFMSWGTGNAHRDGVLTLLEGMITRGAPIDALGVQSHIFAGTGNFGGIDEAAWRSFLNDVTSLGLDLVITEFDINDQNLPADIATRDGLIADYTTAYLGLMLEYSQLRDVLCWGLVHRYSWMQNFQPRSDGLQKRSTPFDDSYQPTPMYDAIAAAFEATTARS